MLVVAVLTLYTSDPNSGEMKALVERMKATGRLVFLKPLDQLRIKKRKKVKVARTLQASLTSLPTN